MLAQPIESPTTGLGISDVFVRTTKIGAWVELKYIKGVYSLPWKVTYEPGQFKWLTQHWQLGGLSVLGIWDSAGLHCYKNQDIREVYDTINGFCMKSINGRAFIDWLDQSSLRPEDSGS